MTRKFASGDVVQATLNGRTMTVEGYDALGNVHCAWIDASGTRQRAIFSEAVLRKVGES